MPSQTQSTVESGHAINENRNTLAGRVTGSPSGTGGTGRRSGSPRGLSRAASLGDDVPASAAATGAPHTPHSRRRPRPFDDHDDEDSEEEFVGRMLNNASELRPDMDNVFLDPAKRNLICTPNDVRTATTALETYMKGTTTVPAGNDKYLIADLIKVIGHQMFLASQIPEIVQSVDFSLI